MKKNTIPLFTCILLLTACGNSKTEGENNADEIATFKEWFENKYQDHFNMEVISTVTSNEDFPFELHGSITKMGPLACAYRYDEAAHERQKYRDTGGHNPWYTYVNDLTDWQQQIKEKANTLKKICEQSDSVAVYHLVKVVETNTLNEPKHFRFVAIYKRGNMNKPITVAQIDTKLRKSIAAVDLAMQDSLVLGDMDFDRLYREATNPIIKAIYAPLPSE